MTQSGGQAAGIQLQVGLDLAFFRNQLPKLGAAAAGYPLTFKVEFDRRSIQNELNALGTNIKKRNYFLEVKTNLAAEIELAKKLTTALDNLGRSQQAARAGVGQRLGVGAIGRAPSQGGLGSKDVEKLYRASARAGLLAFDKEIARTKASMVAAMDAIGIDAIAGLLNGLSSQDARLRAAAESIGENLIKTTKTSLRIASPSKKFEEIGKNVGKGFEKGALSSMDSAFDAMENKMRQRGKILDTIARGIFGMLGMDPAAMMQQARQQRLPAAINWQATTPPRQPFTGPSSGGRALPPGPSQMMLPGTSFGRQKYLPTALGEELKKVLRDAANAFVDTLKTQIRTAKVLDLGRTMQPTLPGSTRIAGLLSPEPPGRYRAGRTEETQAELFARREREARMRSAQRETQTLSERGGVLPGTTFMGDDFTRGGGRDRVTGSGQPRERGGALAFLGGGMGPSSQLGAGYFEVGKGLQAIKQAYAGVKPFLDTKKLPLSGAMAELGGEFGTAIKQVLLYGTAYKALAFFTSLPGQAFEAAKGLATYRNQLKAVTSESQTFDQSLAFVDNLAQRFNVPLDSARQGFVKLYASMQPAGFGQEQIEGLFTGISKAAAAFGLSADKVDRVNYAFAQMASKGQIMSEELKGQLGDVLPGALGLFAQAAQMSIPEFSKAMEDGAFKGKAMTQVLDNVAILMNNKFGPAAQGAAKTLQGAVNQIQNNLTLMYESFGPIVDRFAAIFGPQVNGLIKDVTETMKVLTGTFTAAEEGFATLSPRAQAFYAAIQSLTPPLQQAGAAIADLGGRFATLLPAMVQAIAAAISFASSPLGRGAIIASVAIGTLTAAIKLLEVTGLKAAIKAVYLFIGGLLKIPAATGVARVAIIGLKLALTGVFAGAILLGLDFLIGKLFNIGDAANDSAKDIKGMRKELDAMAGAGDIEGTSKAFLDANTKLAAARKANQKALADLREAKARPEGDTQADINKGVAVANAQTKAEQAYAKVIEAQKEVQAAEKSRASAVALKERQDKETQGALTKIDLSAGDGTGKKPKEQSLESYYSLQDQLAKAQTQADIDRLEAAFEHARAMVNAEYDLKEARANSFQKKAIAFQKEIFAITSEQDAALFKNRNKVLAAAGSVAGGAGLTMGGVVATTGGAVNQDPLTRGRSTGAHLHAQAAGITEKTLRYLVDKYLEIGGKTASAFGQSRGSAGHGYNAIDFLTPQNTPIKLKPGASMSQYGPAGGRGGLMSQVTTPEGSFQLGHLSSLTLGGRGAAPGKVTGDVKRDKLAEQQVALTVREANAANIEKEAEATAKLQIATANYVQSLVPTAEQSLQNQLLQQRITLTQNSFSPEILEAQLAFAGQELQVIENIKKNTEEINRLTAAGGNNAKQINALTDANNQLKANLPVSAIQLYTQAVNDQVLSLVQRAQVAGQDAANQEKINDLIIGGMTRQAAEAKVTADNLRDNYKKALEEATRQVEIAAAAEEVLAAARRLGGKETEAQTAQYNALAQALKDAKKAKDDLEGKAPAVAAAATGIETSVAPKTTKGYLAEGLSEAQENLDKLTNTGYQVVQGANAIGDAFGTAFKNIASGSMTAQQALATMFQSIADHFLDMAAQMIAAWIKMAILNTVIKIFGSAASSSLSGGFGGDNSFSSFDAGGAQAFSAPSLSPGAAFAGGGATNYSSQLGGIAFNPTAFAEGGFVAGPTMGLIGEGGESEYVIPSSKMQSAMARYSRGARGESVIAGSGGGSEGGTATAAAGPMVVDVRYNVERINEVEYVTASQFQAGMRQAAQQGAAQGEQRTLRRLQQSPGTRKRVGM